MFMTKDEINSLNSFFEKHTFTVKNVFFRFDVNVKFEITGIKQYLVIGQPKDFLIYTLYLLPSGKLDNILKHFFRGRDSIAIGTNYEEFPYEILTKCDDLIRKALKYMSIETGIMCNKLVNKMNNNLSEPLIIEGRYDRVTTELSRELVDLFKKRRKKGRLLFDFPFKSKMSVDQLGEIDYPLEITLKYDITYDEEFEEIFDIYGQADDENIELSIKINPKYIPSILSQAIPIIKDAIRHEIEHVAQNNLERDKSERYEKIPKDNFFKYLTARHEIPAFVRGLYKGAKTRRQPLSKAIDGFLTDYSDRLTTDEKDKVRQIWIDYARRNLPAAQLDS